MNCTNPKKIFYLGKKKNGKLNTMITGIGTDYITYDGSSYVACNGNPEFVDKMRYRVFTEHDLIPCGNCISCRLKLSAEYANRGVMESDYHEKAYFITLTYDDDHLHYAKRYINGNIVETPTLMRDDLIRFNKRLRRTSEKELTIVMCGEYGSKTMRPHYHEIVWDLNINDLEPIGSNDNKSKGGNYKYYTSPFLEKKWGKGFVTIGEVNYATIAYVCRYNLKKTKNDLRDYYNLTGVEEEFRQLPKSPGLGKRYFDEHWEEIYKNDEIIHEGFKFKTIRPPRYFDKLLEKIDPITFKTIKEKRKERFGSDEFENLNCSDLIQLDNYHNDMENILAEKIKHLKGGEL